MPMPEPKYPDDTDDAETPGYAETPGGATGKGKAAGGAAAPSALAAWMPLMCKATAEDVVRSAATNVRLIVFVAVDMVMVLRIK